MTRKEELLKAKKELFDLQNEIGRRFIKGVTEKEKKEAKTKWAEEQKTFTHIFTKQQIKKWLV